MITMQQAVAESREGFNPRFEDKYGNRLPFRLANGVPVYAGTPFADLNGQPVQEQDLARYLAQVAFIESGRPARPATKAETAWAAEWFGGKE